MQKGLDGAKDKAYNIDFITPEKLLLASYIISPISNANLGAQQIRIILLSRAVFSAPANARLVSMTLIGGTESARDLEREWVTIS